MKRVYTNAHGRDVVLNPFTQRLAKAKSVHLAAPYFTLPDHIVEAARDGKSVQLLIGLNPTTTPKALAAVSGVPGLSVRYLTHRFHAKIYIFDDEALLGSSNLTQAGLMENREATICLDAAREPEAVDEVKALFVDLWESASVLTDDVLKAFKLGWDAARQVPDREALVEDAVGRVEPVNINIASRQKSKVRAFRDALQRQVYEEFRPNFREVTELLMSGGLRRPELVSVGEANETNRFLNWVRLTHVRGDDAWRLAPMRNQSQRRLEILALGNEWVRTADNCVPDEYVDWLANVEGAFGSADVLRSASKGDITKGLMSLHAFTEQSRYVNEGMARLADAFWSANSNDVERVRGTLLHLVHGGGDFVDRLHDVLYDPRMKLNYVGRFTALELYGTLRPDQCPPMNGRMAKALRFFGFNVSAT